MKHESIGVILLYGWMHSNEYVICYIFDKAFSHLINYLDHLFGFRLPLLPFLPVFLLLWFDGLMLLSFAMCALIEYVNFGLILNHLMPTEMRPFASKFRLIYFFFLLLFKKDRSHKGKSYKNPWKIYSIQWCS